jgi:GNAT superfamily N-acetyltransferase
MTLRTEEYRPEFFRTCVDIMGDTWNFNEYFPGLRISNLINELFFQSAIIGMNHREVIVDDSGNAHGYLFGKLPGEPGVPLQTARDNVRLALRLLYHYLAGSFGDRKNARKIAIDLMQVESLLTGKKTPEHAYVGLFFVSSSLRGMGWGKRLMDRFVNRARYRDASAVYLWTDLGCNYGFYDNYGFTRVVEIASPLLSKFTGGINGFAYEKRLDGASLSQSG